MRLANAAQSVETRLPFNLDVDELHHMEAEARGAENRSENNVAEPMF